SFLIASRLLHWIDNQHSESTVVRRLTSPRLEFEAAAIYEYPERTFTTFGSRGGVVFVINGAWQLGDKLLTTDQGACWFDGRHTLRLLQPQGKLLFSEINWLAGHSPDQVQ
ncbi:hypothetical protein ACUOFC_34330, partial [Escherichia sp. TWPC-MK]